MIERKIASPQVDAITKELQPEEDKNEDELFAHYRAREAVYDEELERKGEYIRDSYLKHLEMASKQHENE